MSWLAQYKWLPGWLRSARRPEVISPIRVTSICAAALAVGVCMLPRPALADWPAFGRALCAQDTVQAYQVITTDGAGGAIVAWQDSRLPRVNIFAGHVTASGALDSAWPLNGTALLTDPVALANAEGGQEGPRIIADGAGGAIVAWEDQRNSETGGLEVFAQHIRSNGVVDGGWPRNGTGLRVIDGAEFGLRLISDDAGGAFAVW